MEIFTSTETIVGLKPHCLKYSTWEKSQNLEKYRQIFVIINIVMYSVLQMVGGDRRSNPVLNFLWEECKYCGTRLLYF